MHFPGHPVHRLLRWLVGTVAAMALAGCLTLVPERALRPGLSTEADVVASQGRPTRAWPEADGGRTLEYATQPFGSSCYMFRIGPDGRLLGFHDALRQPTRDRVVPGMTPEAVRRLLGRERRRETFALSGEEVWDWHLGPEGAGDPLRFNVHFKDGVVVRTSISMVFRSRGAVRS